jgi:hypothetical protein
MLLGQLLNFISKTSSVTIKKLGHFNPIHDKFKMSCALLTNRHPCSANLELLLTHPFPQLDEPDSLNGALNTARTTD